ncbi:putative long-chain-fatty-acid--CoA ligase [Helianthus annuus]|uniref:Long-chain-fatty-acid--CoA ligase n=1 Tax=Helianthus annuus TaxID=4232 RepID=A0A251VHN1_HELAN|nr:putative long-chain-fatty-acid--CoA ligase [Helianthus annuus]KAJ0951430.1 putative long-chain-fatty-acid--CoA ligase [Helianthus annuus]
MPRGEIYLMGNTLFLGNHKREDLTKNVLVNGNVVIPDRMAMERWASKNNELGDYISL